jgi:ethanolamine utilization protein EutN
MILGRVVGELWATQKDDRLARAKLLVVRPHGWYEPRWQTDHLIAVDDVHAGVGDDVLVCLGQPARWSLGAENIPVDAAVMAVVDRVELDADAATPAHAGPGIARRWDPPARWGSKAAR